MKKLNLSLKFIVSGFTIALVMFSCKKDRIAQDEYSSMDSFFNDHKQQEQEFVVDTPGTGPIIGQMDTKIFLNNDIFMFPNGTDVTYPFIIKLVELYPVKDIILWEMPSVGGGTPLNTAAEIRVRAFKDNIELVLKPGRKYYMELDTMTGIVADKQVYYGFQNGAITDWTINLSAISSITTDTMSAVLVNSYFYSMTIGKMGWVSCAKVYTPSSSVTGITFSVTGNNTQNIDVFVVFNNVKSVMQGYNLSSGNLPAGESVRIIAMAKNQNNAYVLHNENITVSSGMVVPLNMQVVSEADILNVLNGL